ncbi:hypothetical protein CEXT_60051, partial [Caerostris extrusa]
MASYHLKGPLTGRLNNCLQCPPGFLSDPSNGIFFSRCVFALNGCTCSESWKSHSMMAKVFLPAEIDRISKAAEGEGIKTKWRD